MICKGEEYEIKNNKLVKMKGVDVGHTPIKLVKPGG